MSVDEKQEMSGHDRILQRRFRQIGAFLLVAGLLAAVIVNWKATPDDGSPDANTLNDSKRYEYEMERIGGKSNMVAAELRDWFGSLWHGKRLAHTLVFLSVGGFLGCFFAAHLLTYPPPPDNPTEGKDV
jgi:hypothetical protein